MLAQNTLVTPYIIRLPGSLDAKQNQNAWKNLKPRIGLRPTQILLDLSHITLLDWQDVTLLMEAFLASQQVGGKLAIMKANDAVKLFLDLTQVSSLIPVFDDEACALNFSMN